jgi:erythritol transport system permease protein
MSNQAVKSRRNLFQGFTLGKLLTEGRAFVALAVIVIVFSSLSPNYLSISNVVVMTRHVGLNALLAIGMLLVILTAGIDLSVGSTVGLSGVLAGFMLMQGIQIPGTQTVLYPSVWVIVVLCLASGGLVGLLNGVLITRFKVAPFITTLGTLYVVRGAALLLAKGETFNDMTGKPELGNTGFSVLGLGKFLGLPTGVWVMVVVALMTAILLRKTVFGRWLYALGGNERAAELSGVPIKRVKIWVYTLSGICAAATGLIIASELTAGAPQTGQSYELNAIAAVVIGGAALSGGRGHIRGTLLGAFVIGFLGDGLVIVGVSSFWQMVIQGSVIILAVALDEAQQGAKKKQKQAKAAAEN